MKFYVLIVGIVLTSFIIPAYAIPATSAEIVITDIWLDPPHPQAGDKVTILGNVYNAGKVPTEYHASVVTLAIFIDGELRKIDELGNIKPGITNNITISSGPLWEAEWGEHKFKIIIDYHDTLQDSFDNPLNNKLEKVFTIEPIRDTLILLNVSPSHILPEKHQKISVNGTLLEKDTREPIGEQNIILTIGDSRFPLITNENGQFFIISAITFLKEKTLVTASFDEVFPYSSTSQTHDLLLLPTSKYNSVLVLKIEDPLLKYDFSNMDTEIITFQNSYDMIFGKKSSSDKGVLLDNKTAWIGLEGGYYYLQEVYVKGRYFATIDWNFIRENEVIEKTLYVPEPAEIKFHVTDINKVPISGAIVENWIYNEITDDNGFTNWIETLPNPTNKEPYLAVVTTSDGQIFRSEPFLVVSEEKKIIEIITKEPESLIPQWIRNSAEWWSNEQISTNDFIIGLEYLIEKKVLVISSSESDGDEKRIPSWIKNNAKWWSEGKILDRDFVTGLQYLINEGIIRV